EALGDQDRPVAVDHEPRQPVGFAPDEATEGRRPLGVALSSQGRGGLEPALKEGGVERLIGPGENAAAEGGLGIVEAAAYEAAARVDDDNRRAGLDVAGVRDIALEDPRMGPCGFVAPLEAERRLTALQRRNASAVIAQRSWSRHRPQTFR